MEKREEDQRKWITKDQICERCNKKFDATRRRRFCSRKCSSDENKRENNCKWAGDKITYVGIHLWLRRTFGKAKKCEICLQEGEERYEWALKKGLKHKRRR